MAKRIGQLKTRWTQYPLCINNLPTVLCLQHIVKMQVPMQRDLLRDLPKQAPSQKLRLLEIRILKLRLHKCGEQRSQRCQPLTFHLAGQEFLRDIG